MSTKVEAKPTTVAPKEALSRFIEAFEELLESLEYSSPQFWKEIEESRKSGRVSAKEIERRLGIDVKALR